MLECILGAFLIKCPQNRFYFSGFTGTEGYLLILPQKQIILVDSRYVEQAKNQCVGYEVRQLKSSIYKELPPVLKEEGINSLGFEGDFWSYEDWIKLDEALKEISLKSFPKIIEGLRIQKDKGEIACIDRAVEVADKAFSHILPMLRIGVSEAEIGLELEFYMRKLGASGCSFTSIVASGIRSALPHGVASSKKLEKGDLLVLDFGAIVDGYCSDMTRTVAIGFANSKQKEIYKIVLEANLKGLETLRKDIKACEVDKACRDIIKSYGYGDYFGHSTGHGVGLMIHEAPTLSFKNEMLLKEGMVVTVEPGIYLPDFGGVRIEDMAFINKENSVIFTSSPKKDLIVCG